MLNKYEHLVILIDKVTLNGTKNSDQSFNRGKVI